MNEAINKTLKRHGADLDAGIKHRGRLKAVGFVDVDTGGSPQMTANDEQWEFFFENMGQRSPKIRDEAVELGLLTAEEIEKYRSWELQHHNDPAAVNMRMWFDTTGRKP